MLYADQEKDKPYITSVFKEKGCTSESFSDGGLYE